MANTSSEEVTREQLISDFKVVLADAEALLRAMGNHGSGKEADLRSKAEASLRSMRTKIGEVENSLLGTTRAAAKTTDEYVHNNPWTAIGAAAAVGLTLGLLFKRR